ncbi:HutD/Ves family protein [Neorhizobium sp. DAR64861/K0K2]|uniref:HutD/Ves family protein n=1 Tax=unclassified Neorhizobium TaxID=2629175 RepID=UPI003D29AA4C
MRILRASDYRRMPWKNGKGETVEIAVFPETATVDDFDWRISMATVAEDGPFSVFPDIDRTLSVLTGDGIELSVAGQPDHVLRPQTAPHAFPADAVTSAKLLSGPITDLNVMTRRGRFTHSVTLLPTGRSAVRSDSSALTLVLVTSDVLLKDGTLLAAYDAILLHPGDSDVEFHLTVTATTFLVRIASRQKASVSLQV